MARAVAPREDNTQSPVASSSGSGQSEQKVSKRRCVQSACVPCRKRKSKCDGGTPVCATCTAVYKTECHYDAESESRRGKTAAKRDSASMGESSTGAADIIVASIRSLPESEIQDIIHQIRRDDNLECLAESLRKVVTLPPKLESQTSSLEGDLAVLIGKPALTQSGVSRHYGHTSSLALVREDENYSQPTAVSPPSKLETWTAVTADTKFLYHLFELYFKWSHPFYVLFSRECFYKDFKTGRQKYCSPLLVNAICAYACHSSDEPLARTDPSNSRTAGDHFFAEARRLLFEDESPRLTTVQALAIMGLREASAGRDSSGFMYAGRCLRMAVELGLHLNYSASPHLGLTRSEIEVRKVTFWGCFTCDTAWSLAIGRISQLPRTAINLDKPILEEPVSLEKGQLFLDSSRRESQPVFTNRQFLQQFSTLSELVSDCVFTFFAPRERFTSRRLLDSYNKYSNWYKGLPKALQLDPNDKSLPIPHVLTLHMYYHTCIVHLFRPLMKVDLLHSDVRPREKSIGSANIVSEILSLYRRHYSLRSCNILLTHILLSTTTVHLVNSATSIGRQNLIDGLRALEEMSTCHHFAARSFKIIYNLCCKWNLPFPDELKNSSLVPSEESSLVSPTRSNFFTTIPPQVASQPPQPEYTPITSASDDASRRESLNMFTAQTLASSLPSRSSGTTTSPPLSFASTSATQSQTLAPADQLFWTPFQGQGVPLLGNNMHVSPMDLSNMLGAVDQWEDFSRDGFKMSDSWAQDPMAHVAQGMPENRMGTAGGGFAEWWGNGTGGGG